MLGRLHLASGAGVLLLASLAAAQTPGGPPGFPGGPFEPAKPGQILPGPLQDQLKLTAEQKKKLEELQKEVDAKLAKILTEEQKKSLEEMRQNPFRGGFGPGGGFGPPGGFGGGFVPPRMDDVRKQIKATEEEWKVIEPKLKKVVAARQVLAVEVRATEFGFGAPGGFGPGGFGGPTGNNIITQAQGELKAVLDDPKHTKAEVDEKVAAVRKARQKARSEADAAQKDLLQMLTAAQEAVLVSLGYVE
jgi:Spy/CpxP family protein refolding chaperone